LVHAKAKLLLTTEKTRNRVKDVLEDIPVIALDSAEFQQQLDEHTLKDPHKEGPQPRHDLATLFYTSGTTDLPKAVMLTHANLLANADSIARLGVLTHSDTVISVLPLHHTYAFTTTLLAPLLTGATVVFPPTISSVGLLTCIRSTQATILIGVPQMFTLIYRSIQEKIESIPPSKKFALRAASRISMAASRATGSNLNKKLFRTLHQAFGEHLRYMVSGGARLDPDIAKAFGQWGFTVLEGYGLTETAPLATFNTPGARKAGSVGKPIANVAVRIIDPDEKGIGEVAIKGPNVMKGYYNMPEQTRAVLKDGWFLTGDLGYVDKDGFLFLIGRKKEIIVLSSGKNINPEDIEKQYEQSPFIQEICVLATKQGTDYLKGVEHLAAVVSIDEEYFKAMQEPNIRQRLKWEIENLSSQLPTYKRLRGFVVTTQPLPRTRLGKLQRFQINELYTRLLKSSAGKPAGPPPKSEPDTGSEQYSHFAQIALNFLSKTLRREVKAEDHLELDLGLDSLGRVELLLGLQNTLNLDLSEEEAMQFFMSNTVNDLLVELKKYLPRLSKDVQEEHLPVWGTILKEEPPEEIKQKIDLKVTASQIAALLLILVIKIIFRVCFLLKVEGRENVKHTGAYLICPNHVSYLDALVVLSALPFKTVLNTFFVGYNQIFKKFFLRNLTKMARLIPIETSYNLVDALRTCAYVLTHDRSVCYFPEGQRSIDGEVKEFKTGVGILMKEINVPVVPAFIAGSFEAWPRTRKFPRFRRITIRFGQRCTVKDLLDNDTDAPDDAYQNIAHRLRQKVQGLKPR
jgi:long-chain acyl-CoA synthetase